MDEKILLLMEEILRKNAEHIKKFLQKNNVNLSVKEMLLLAQITKLRDTSQNSTTDIANELNITPSAVSISLKQLEKKSFLYRYHDIDDRRKIFIGLTKQTQVLVKSFLQYQSHIINQMTSSLHQVKQKDFLASIYEMSNNIKNI